MKRQWPSSVLWVVCLLGAAGCDVGHVLKAPAPPGVVPASTLQGSAAALATFYSARAEFSGAVGGDLSQDGGGVIELGGMLTDEFSSAYNTYYGINSIDFRVTSFNTGNGGNILEPGDYTVMSLLAARSAFLLNLGSLETYATTASAARIGEAYALMGYTELYLAETFCPGVPLSQPIAGGGVQYGMPLTMDSLLGVAKAHFDSALAHTGNNDSITVLAHLGLARTWMDQGEYDSASAAVGSVSTSFVYNIVGNTVSYNQYFYPNLYQTPLSVTGCTTWNAADREGTNGLDFISAGDPRLVFVTGLAETCDGAYYGLPDTTFYYPIKFGNPAPVIPIASGIEARLIEAEAALEQEHTTEWLTDLNNLRNSNDCTDLTNATCTLGTGNISGQATGVYSLTDPGDSPGDSLRVDLMFRERAFWLYGTGTRLGDLRRLIRQYHRANESVFPTGAYALGHDPVIAPAAASGGSPLPLTYGPDVVVTLPTRQSVSATITNPNYKGCLSSTTTA